MHMHGTAEIADAKPYKPATEIRDQAICVDVANGMTEREAAAKHGVHHRTVAHAKKRQSGFLDALREKVQRGKVRQFMRTVKATFSAATQTDDLRSAVQAQKLVYENLYREAFGTKGGGVNIHNGDVNVTNTQLNVQLNADALRYDADEDAALSEELGL